MVFLHNFPPKKRLEEVCLVCGCPSYQQLENGVFCNLNNSMGAQGMRCLNKNNLQKLNLLANLNERDVNKMKFL